MEFGKKGKFPYKLARLVEGKSKWYVIYYVWNNITEKLQRIRLDVLGNTEKEKRADADALIKEVNKLLKSGAYAGKKIEPKVTENSDLHPDITYHQASQYFMKAKKDLGKDTRSLYEGYFRDFNAYLEERGKARIPLKKITVPLVFEYFDGLNLAPKTRNNMIGFIRGFFTFFQKRKVIKDNPTAGFDLDSVVDSDDHRPFTPAEVQQIKQAMMELDDPQLWLFCQFMYYTYARPGKELRLLKVGDLLEKTIRISGQRGKTNKVRYPKIPPALEACIREKNLRKYPATDFVFTTDGHPGPVPVGVNYFYKRHTKALEKAGMKGQDFDLYSWKPTGVIALYKATKDIKLLQHQCGHSTIEQTDRYLRKFGLFLDEDQMNDFPVV